MGFDFPHAGEVYSVLTALVWSVAVILFRRSGDHVPPLALNVFKNTVALALLVTTMLVLGSTFVPRERSAGDWAALLLSGALGLGVADALVFASLNRIGASRAAIVDCLYTPSIFVCSSLMLNEPLRPLVLVAGALVVGAVFLGTRGEVEEGGPDKEPARKRIAVGIGLGLAAMAVLGVAVVLAKPVLDRTSDPWWAITVRVVGGLGTAYLLAAFEDWRALVSAFRPGPSWRVTVPAAVIGTYLSMTLWILGIKFTKGVTTAGVLNQTSTIFTLVLAAIFLKERLTPRRVLAIALGFSGAALVSLDRILAK